MYKNLPTAGFKYDWNQFRNHDGLFVVRVRGHAHSNHINNHVKHLKPDEMDTFCAEVFDKATELLDDLSSTGVEHFWAKVAQDLGIQLLARTAQSLAFWGWAMKLVAARIAFGQEGLTVSDAAGDIEMSDQPNREVSHREPLNLAAQAVDKFLAVGISKYGGSPKKLRAITRHHEIVAPIRVGPEKPAMNGSAPAKNASKNSHTGTHDSHLQLRPTPSIKSTNTSPPVTIWFSNGAQHHAGTVQGSSGQAGAVDDLIIGMHGTAIEDATRAPQVLADLAIRTVNPSKRRHEDTEGAEDGGRGDQPLAKMAKVSRSHADTSGSPSQVDEPYGVGSYAQKRAWAW
ncbi:hypothetical protein LA080_010177 [Diaporthe eres]|nr:hypothetical protein LA080_010177 [Diaporthe eres]